MSQSVMSRTVGSNGKIFAMYPNDAMPIEEYPNEHGVLDLARMYGYGDWSWRVRVRVRVRMLPLKKMMILVYGYVI